MYKLTNGNYIQRVADGAWIPNDPSNRDYAEYQAWLAVGNVPLPADPVPVPIPADPVVTQSQLQAALAASGVAAPQVSEAMTAVKAQA